MHGSPAILDTHPNLNAAAMAGYECVYNMVLLTRLKNQTLKTIGRRPVGPVGFNFRIKK